jgi:hypothetical protein
VNYLRTKSNLVILSLKLNMKEKRICQLLTYLLITRRSLFYLKSMAEVSYLSVRGWLGLGIEFREQLLN